MYMANGLNSASDVIAFKDVQIDTGGQKAGNGGDGYYSGGISNAPKIDFQPYNMAYSADPTVKTGDHVEQTAGNHSDQSSSSGYDSSTGNADTSATQTNSLTANSHQYVSAGNGGDGGSDNSATGGNVPFTQLHMDTTSLDNVLNDAEHFHINDSVHF
jgi:hypothetical protein